MTDEEYVIFARMEPTEFWLKMVRSFTPGERTQFENMKATTEAKLAEIMTTTPSAER